MTVRGLYLSSSMFYLSVFFDSGCRIMLALAKSIVIYPTRNHENTE